MTEQEFFRRFDVHLAKSDEILREMREESARSRELAERFLEETERSREQAERFREETERSREQAERFREETERFREETERFREATERHQHAAARESALNRRAIERDRVAFEDVREYIAGQTDILRGLADEVRDLRAESGAHRQSLLRLIDRMDRWMPGSEPA